MIRLLKAATAILCAVGVTAFASTSNATASITDLDGTVWANGTFIATLASATSGPTIAGAPVTPLRVTGTLSGSGALTATLTDTSSIDQSGATWSFHICPNASAPCVDVTSIAVTGAAPNLSTVLSAGLKGPRFNTGTSAYGYADIEVLGSPSLGASYYNVTTPCLRQFSLAGWTCGGGSGGASGTATPQGTACTISQTYTQNVGGVSQVWDPSPNCMVFTNRTTGAVVYAGTAMYTTGFTQCLELSEGTGTTTADACGHSASTLTGSPLPVWNGTNGLTYNGTFGSYVALSNTTLIPHSTYLVCIRQPASVYSGTNFRPWLLAQISGGSLLSFDQYGDLNLGGTSGVQNLQSSVQGISDNVPACLTYVYDGSGNDRFYLGSAKLSIKNPGNSLQTITTSAGLGTLFQGQLYKFYAIEGTELADDYIQHNALVESARIAAATSLTVPTVPAGYQAGNASIWYAGDSRVSGNGNILNSPGYYITQQNQIPNMSLYNAATPAQTMANYVAGNIYLQAPSLLNQLAIPSSSPPPHILIEAMGINDFDSNASGAEVYALFKTAMSQTYGSGWRTIIETVYASSTSSGAQNTQRLAYNTLLIAGGQANEVVDMANDPHFTDRTGTLTYVQWGLFSPYYIDGLHPTPAGAQVIAGRHLNALNRLGVIGEGRTYSTPYAANLVIDLAKGDTQDILLTGNVASFKVINYNQGERFTLNFIQDGTGGRTVAFPTAGSGATATATSGGTVTLTGGGTLYDSNYQPTIYTSGLTCTTYPRYGSTIAAGIITGTTQVVAPVGCTGTATVQFLSSEPVWHGTMTVTGTANTATSQSFTVDALGQNIYSVNQTAQ